MSTTSTDTASRLAADLEGLTISSNRASNNKSSDMSPLIPSLQQFYQTGLLLFQVDASSSSSSNYSDLLMAFQHLVETIPNTLLQGSFLHLQQASKALIKKTNSTNIATTLTPATRSLAGLFTNSPRLCHVTFTSEWLSVLASMYDKLVLAKQSDKHKEVVLSSISALLLDGLFLKKDSTKSVEEALFEAIAAMEEESRDCLRDLQLWQAQHEPLQRSLQSELQKQDEKGDQIDDERIQQREYILNMLDSARQQSPSTHVPSMDGQESTKQKPNSNSTAATNASPTSELDRRIQQVKQILPHLGEGFIEAALSLHQADVETTVATLLNDPSQYPSALRILDPNLPRRKKEHNLQDDAADAEQARQIVKERVALEEQREQQRYQALMYVTSQQTDSEEREKAKVHHNFKDEYNDDYDDQYDEVDIRLGGADDGFTGDRDMDFEQVKMYNQLVRDDQKEDSFWEDNRNTNRPQNKVGRGASPKNDGAGGKQYKGPDKIKGGRVIGPDGKIVKKPGGARKRNNNKKGPAQAQAQGSGKTNTNSKGQQPNGNLMQPNTNNKKPKTKPKSDNRVNRRRDQKQRKQGTFGVQD